MNAHEILRQRQAPSFAVLNQRLDVVAVEPRFWTLCAQAGSCDGRERLPAALEEALRRLIAACPEGGTSVCGSLFVRVIILAGAEGARIAVALERASCREPLQAAARRFHLTPREAAVLELILQGLCAREIAARLQIAQATVGEYFKHLSAKTDAHGRAQMIARVLDYTVGA